MPQVKVDHVLILVIVAFMLYHLMNRCSCSNDGFSVGQESSITEPERSHIPFTCGTCPLVEAICPHSCSNIYNGKICRSWGSRGIEQVCDNCPHPSQRPDNSFRKDLCIPDNADDSLYIGNLDLEIKTAYAVDTVLSVQYKYEEGKWVKSTKDTNTTHEDDVQDSNVLTTLNNLKSPPYYIDSIGLFWVSGETLQLYDYEIRINSTKQNRFLFDFTTYYFTDDTGDIYSIFYDVKQHTNYDSTNNKLMYISVS